MWLSSQRIAHSRTGRGFGCLSRYARKPAICRAGALSAGDGRKARSERGGRIVWMRASSSPSRAAIRGNAGSSAGSVVMGRPCAVPATRRIAKNGLPMIPESAQATSGWGTATPAVNTAFSTANSSIRDRLDGIPVAAWVRSTRRCVRPSEPPANAASNPQFSWIAPPDSRLKAAISTRSAPLASARKRDSGARSNGRNAVAAINRDDRAGHISARRRRQKKQRAVKVRRLGNPPQRNAVDQILAGLGLEVFAIEIGLDIAGRQRVDENAVTRQFHRQHMHQGDQAGFL